MPGARDACGACKSVWAACEGRKSFLFSVPKQLESNVNARLSLKSEGRRPGRCGSLVVVLSSSPFVPRENRRRPRIEWVRALTFILSPFLPKGWKSLSRKTGCAAFQFPKTTAMKAAAASPRGERRRADDEKTTTSYLAGFWEQRVGGR